MAQPLCGARRRDGGTCTYKAMLGGTRCRRHGGAIPSVRAAAKRRLAEQAATRAVEREGIAPLGDPVEMLRELAAEAIGLKDFFAARLAALEELRYQGAGQAGEQLRAEVALYERALDRSQKFLHDLAKLGLDERQVRVSEAQVVILVGIINRGLAASNLDADQVITVRANMAAEMRKIGAGDG